MSLPGWVRRSLNDHPPWLPTWLPNDPRLFRLEHTLLAAPSWKRASPQAGGPGRGGASSMVGRRSTVRFRKVAPLLFAGQRQSSVIRGQAPGDGPAEANHVGASKELLSDCAIVVALLHICKERCPGDVNAPGAPLGLGFGVLVVFAQVRPLILSIRLGR